MIGAVTKSQVIEYKLKSNMNTYKIPCTWTMYGTYEIEASDIEEAAEKARHLPLPENAEYIEDSFNVDTDLAHELI